MIAYLKANYFMIETTIFDEKNKPSESKKNEVVDFLYDNLESMGP